MRRLILGGLSLALGCLTVQSQAQDLRWRPANPGTTVNSKAVSQPSNSSTNISTNQGRPISLRRPVPLEPPTAPGASQLVQPVEFTRTSNSLPRPIIRANLDTEAVRPVQASGGPNLTTVPPPMPLPGQQPETAPAPRALPNTGDGGKNAAGTNVPVPYNAQIVPFPGGEVIEPDWGGAEPIAPECVDCFSINRDCCRIPAFYWGAEFLLWDLKDANLPPLVTATTLTPAELVALRDANPDFRPGAIGAAGTQLLLGGGEADSDIYSGGRFTIGFGPRRWNFGFETTFFFLGEQTDNFTATSFGRPALYRPFFNVTDPGNDAELVAFPNLLAGTVSVEQKTRLWGLEANFRRPLWCGCRHQVDFLLGFRFLELNESLMARESVTFLVDAGDITRGDNIQVFDSFGTRNRFYGGQFGFDWKWLRNGPWYLNVLTKIGLGNMHQTANVNGGTTFTTLGGNQVTATGGLLAQQTNIGSHVTNSFAVVPEVGVKLGYQITDKMSIYVAYNFLYVSSVVRPGDQVDLSINTTQIPAINSRVGGGGQLQGEPRPMFIFKDTDFWAQGFNVGLEWRY